MKRRNFIKKVGFAAGAPIALNGVPLKLLASHSDLQRLAAQSDNDRVLIILQMHGGNDGLNTVIPIGNYDHYYSRRANIAIPYKSGRRTLIPLDSTMAAADQVGLHPDMQDFKWMYDNGRAAIFQGVSYQNNNGSHFRGRDIWFMGGDYDEYFDSGWVGRYLNHEYNPLQYPNDFPTEEMKDPLALEMGSEVSLLFHQSGNIPMSIALGSSPETLANKIDSLSGFMDNGIDPRGLPPEFLASTKYGREMDWILSLEDKSEYYVKRLNELYSNANGTSVTYPEFYPYVTPDGSRNNGLSSQLKLIAQLLEGGVKTKIFLVKVGGFDTHASQVVENDPTMGSHAALLYHISSAMRAFNADLTFRGLSDRVLTLTMSEFGRRVHSNGSFGTDHGTGGPVMMFGAGVKPGVYGTNPDMSANNVGMQFDYRQVYANVLHDWMGVDQDVIANDIFYKDFISGTSDDGSMTYEPMDLIKDVITNVDDYIKVNYHIENLYPNPATNYVNVNLFINDSQTVMVELINMEGRVVLRNIRNLSPGSHTVSFQLNDVKPGMYFIKAKSEKLNDTKRLFVRK